jgi:hypothetical protein
MKNDGIKQNKIDHDEVKIQENILSKLEPQANKRVLDVPEVETEKTNFKKVKSEVILIKDLL